MMRVGATADSILGSAAADAGAAASVDPIRLAIQQDLRNTQFYKGRADGRVGDEDAMAAAIRVVQLNAGLPITGVYNDAVHHAIAVFVQTSPSGNPRWVDLPVASPLPAPVTLPTPVPTPAPAPPTRLHQSPIVTLLQLSLITSPIWFALLILPRIRERSGSTRSSAQSVRQHGRRPRYAFSPAGRSRIVRRRP